jgi:hypothetical protein
VARLAGRPVRDSMYGFFWAPFDETNINDLANGTICDLRRACHLLQLLSEPRAEGRNGGEEDDKS